MALLMDTGRFARERGGEGVLPLLKEDSDRLVAMVKLVLGDRVVVSGETGDAFSKLDEFEKFEAKENFASVLGSGEVELLVVFRLRAASEGSGWRAVCPSRMSSLADILGTVKMVPELPEKLKFSLSAGEKKKIFIIQVEQK